MIAPASACRTRGSPTTSSLTSSSALVPSLSEPVGDVIATYPTTDLMRFQLDRLEDVYASTRREPLGKTYVRGHAIPSGLGETIPFGAPGGVDARSSAAKELVFPAARTRR